MRRRRHELSSVGFDDSLQLVGGDPLISPDNFGLLVPPFAPESGYLFLLSSADLLVGDSITGIRQYAELGAQVSTVPPTPPQGPAPRVVVAELAPYYVFPFRIQTPGWHPPNGFLTWILTLENFSGRPLLSGPVDRESFRFLDSQQPALVYQTATIPALPARPGYLGLTAYTRPALLGVPELVLRSIQYPWDNPTCNRALSRPVTSSTRARLYVWLRQTDPQSRPTPPTVTDVGALCPEDRYVSSFASSYQYWRVAGELDVERAKRQEDTEPAR